MNQLNEEIRAIQTQITTLENRLYEHKTVMTDKQQNELINHILDLHQELRVRLEQTKEVYSV